MKCDKTWWFFTVLYNTGYTLLIIYLIFFEFYVFVDWTYLITKFGKYLILLFFLDFYFLYFFGTRLAGFQNTFYYKTYFIWFFWILCFCGLDLLDYKIRKIPYTTIFFGFLFFIFFWDQTCWISKSFLLQNLLYMMENTWWLRILGREDCWSLWKYHLITCLIILCYHMITRLIVLCYHMITCLIVLC